MSNTILKPQEGPQEMYCATECDLAYYGGAAKKNWPFTE